MTKPSMRWGSVWSGVAVVTFMSYASPLHSQSEDALTAFDSLLQTPISTASKHDQTMREAPASATVVTSEEIELFGYTTLAEVLENVRGFYVSYDRSYVSLGVRGFSQPGGHNNKILVLLDGHALNENFYDGARLGTAFPIDLSAVDRIEIVRGPGSALYGSNAVFAVINIITKTRESLGGVRASGWVGSYATRNAAVTAGYELGSGGQFLLSGIVGDTEGQDHYFGEFDSPATNNGIAEGLDWGDLHGFLGAVRYRDFRVTAMSTSRRKANPTAMFGAVFNDPLISGDTRSFAEAQLDTQLSSSAGLLLRAYYDEFRLEADFTSRLGLPVDVTANGRWVGAEARFRWDDGSAHRFSLGAEVRRHLEARYDGGDAIYRVSGNPTWSIASAYAQSELQVLENLSVTIGGRFDHYTRTGSAFTPRGAVVFHPGENTTMKLLYGEAFRAPNQWELIFEAPNYFKLNPDLGPETGRTIELVWEQRLRRGVFGTVSLYDYTMEGLIQWVLDPVDGLPMHDNAARVNARGVELGVDARFSEAVSISAGYALQRAQDAALGIDRPDSPRNQFRVGGFVRPGRGPTLAAAVLVGGSRNTIRGFPTDSYVRGDVTVTSGNMLNAVRIMLRVNNVFDSEIRHPAGSEHNQHSIPQNGRNFEVRATLAY